MQIGTLSKKELVLYCKKNGIKGYSGKNKEDIVDLINSSLLTNEKVSSNVVEKRKKLVLKGSKSPMTFIDLFCGVGGFHQALDRHGLKCVLACDTDKHCRATYERNYGIQVHPDVRKLHVDDVPNCDVLCGGFPCFISGTRVLTNTGYINIEDVSTDMKLLTHKNNWKQIMNKQTKVYNGELVNIDIKYHPETIVCTPEHPFFVRNRMKKWDNINRRYVYTFSEPSWEEAKNIHPETFVGIPINKRSIVPEFKFKKDINSHKKETVSISLNDKDMWFMMGYFMGDGWVEDTIKKNSNKPYYKIRFAINLDDELYVTQRINNIIKITDKKCNSGTKCKKYGCSDIIWYNILKQFGKYAHGKCIPEWVQDAPIDYIKEFIHGYTTADGYINDTLYSLIEYINLR